MCKVAPNCHNCSIRSQSVFKDVTESELSLMESQKKNIIFKKGERIFEEGTYPHGLYCVYNGKVKLTQLGSDGKEQIIHLAKDGDLMGYRAILNSDKYSCSAVALEDCSVCFMNKDFIFQLIKENNQVTLDIMSMIAGELRQTEKKVTSLAQNPVKERLAQSLLQLSNCYGIEKENEAIDITMTREEIANIAGTTRETVTRALMELEDENIIELKGKKIKILSYSLLTRAAKVFE